MRLLILGLIYLLHSNLALSSENSSIEKASCFFNLVPFGNTTKAITHLTMLKKQIKGIQPAIAARKWHLLAVSLTKNDPDKKFVREAWQQTFEQVTDLTDRLINKANQNTRERIQKYLRTIFSNDKKRVMAAIVLESYQKHGGLPFITLAMAEQITQGGDLSLANYKQILLKIGNAKNNEADIGFLYHLLQATRGAVQSCILTNLFQTFGLKKLTNDCNLEPIYKYIGNISTIKTESWQKGALALAHLIGAYDRPCEFVFEEKPWLGEPIKRMFEAIHRNPNHLPILAGFVDAFLTINKDLISEAIKLDFMDSIETLQYPDNLANSFTAIRFGLRVQEKILRWVRFAAFQPKALYNYLCPPTNGDYYQKAAQYSEEEKTEIKSAIENLEDEDVKILIEFFYSTLGLNSDYLEAIAFDFWIWDTAPPDKEDIQKLFALLTKIRPSITSGFVKNQLIELLTNPTSSFAKLPKKGFRAWVDALAIWEKQHLPYLLNKS